MSRFDRSGKFTWYLKSRQNSIWRNFSSFFRPPSHDPEESGDDDPDDSHTEDISDLENVYVNSATSENVVKMHRGRFNILPCVTAGNSRPSNNRFVWFTVWKIQHFSVTQILREINIRECKGWKNAIFAISGALKFGFG